LVSKGRGELSSRMGSKNMANIFSATLSSTAVEKCIENITLLLSYIMAAIPELNEAYNRSEAAV